MFSAEACNDDVMHDFFVDLPSLSDSERESLEGPFSEEEVLRTLKGMKDFASPGPDGLPKEFYLLFLYSICSTLVKYFNYCFGMGELSPSQRLSFIKLICKDPTKAKDLKFWRPISLLNVDYKIISKVLCNRLCNVLSYLVHLCQVVQLLTTPTYHVLCLISFLKKFTLFISLSR